MGLWAGGWMGCAEIVSAATAALPDAIEFGGCFLRPSGLAGGVGSGAHQAWLTGATS